jgi:hypothetical protein
MKKVKKDPQFVIMSRTRETFVADFEDGAVRRLTRRKIAWDAPTQY